MSKSQAVDATVTLVVRCAVVQKPTDASTPSTMCINNESEAVKLAHGVDAGGANTSLTVFRIP